MKLLAIAIISVTFLAVLGDRSKLKCRACMDGDVNALGLPGEGKCKREAEKPFRRLFYPLAEYYSSKDGLESLPDDFDAKRFLRDLEREGFDLDDNWFGPKGEGAEVLKELLRNRGNCRPERTTSEAPGSTRPPRLASSCDRFDLGDLKCGNLNSCMKKYGVGPDKGKGKGKGKRCEPPSGIPQSDPPFNWLTGDVEAAGGNVFDEAKKAAFVAFAAGSNLGEVQAALFGILTPPPTTEAPTSTASSGSGRQRRDSDEDEPELDLEDPRSRGKIATIIAWNALLQFSLGKAKLSDTPIDACLALIEATAPPEQTTAAPPTSTVSSDGCGDEFEREQRGIKIQIARQCAFIAGAAQIKLGQGNNIKEIVDEVYALDMFLDLPSVDEDGADKRVRGLQGMASSFVKANERSGKNYICGGGVWNHFAQLPERRAGGGGSIASGPGGDDDDDDEQEEKKQRLYDCVEGDLDLKEAAKELNNLFNQLKGKKCNVKPELVNKNGVETEEEKEEKEKREKKNKGKGKGKDHEWKLSKFWGKDCVEFEDQKQFGGGDVRNEVIRGVSDIFVIKAMLASVCKCDDDSTTEAPPTTTATVTGEADDAEPLSIGEIKRVLLAWVASQKSGVVPEEGDADFEVLELFRQYEKYLKKTGALLAFFCDKDEVGDQEDEDDDEDEGKRARRDLERYRRGAGGARPDQCPLFEDDERPDIAPGCKVLNILGRVNPSGGIKKLTQKCKLSAAFIGSITWSPALAEPESEEFAELEDLVCNHPQYGFLKDRSDGSPSVFIKCTLASVEQVVSSRAKRNAMSDVSVSVDLEAGDDVSDDDLLDESSNIMSAAGSEVLEAPEVTASAPAAVGASPVAKAGFGMIAAVLCVVFYA